MCECLDAIGCVCVCLSVLCVFVCLCACLLGMSLPEWNVALRSWIIRPRVLTKNVQSCMSWVFCLHSLYHFIWTFSLTCLGHCFYTSRVCLSLLLSLLSLHRFVCCVDSLPFCFSAQINMSRLLLSILIIFFTTYYPFKCSKQYFCHCIFYYPLFHVSVQTTVSCLLFLVCFMIALTEWHFAFINSIIPSVVIWTLCVSVCVF